MKYVYIVQIKVEGDYSCYYWDTVAVFQNKKKATDCSVQLLSQKKGDMEEQLYDGVRILLFGVEKKKIDVIVTHDDNGGGSIAFGSTVIYEVTYAKERN